MRMRREGMPVSLFDVALGSLLVFAAMFAITVIKINPKSKAKPIIETRGKFLIVINWEDGSRDDVDIYVQDPMGKIVYFQNRDTGLMHLEHDDLGMRGDQMVSTAGDVKVVRNEERVVLRGTVPGEYVVNVHMYRKTEAGPTTVNIFLNQLIGNDKELYRVERVLAQQKEEKTAFRFTITKADMVRDINELPKPIMGRLNDPRFGGQQ